MDPIYKVNANGLRRCPYNPSHKVQALRFIAHLLKCAEKSKIKLIMCPWNATHHVHPEDYNHHLSTCENQESLDGIANFAIPESAFVREHKTLANMEQNEPEYEVVTDGGNEVLYQEPIYTNHDYEVEVYNRRFQTQEFCTRDIDEFDNPPINTNQVQFDMYGNIVKGNVPKENNLPVNAEDDVQSDDSDEGSAFPNATGCSSRCDEKDNTNSLVLATLSLNDKMHYPNRTLRGLPQKKAISQPITAPVEDTPIQKSPPATALSAAMKENVSHSAVLQAPEGALRCRLAPGRGRGYQLKKLLNQQKNEVSGPGEAATSRGAGRGRG